MALRRASTEPGLGKEAPRNSGWVVPTKESIRLELAKLPEREMHVNYRPWREKTDAVWEECILPPDPAPWQTPPLRTPRWSPAPSQLPRALGKVWSFLQRQVSF